MLNSSSIKMFVSYLAYLCIGIALITGAQAGHLLIKAKLAQYLLESAWQRQISTSKVLDNSEIKPWPWADIYPVAKLTFDRFNLSQIVLNNDSGQALAFGPGLNKFNTFADGNSVGNVYVIAAHNDTHFKILEQLALNDRITLMLSSGQSYAFTVSSIRVMNTQIEQLILLNKSNQSYFNINETNNTSELILVTCYPFLGVNRNTDLRLIVRLDEL